MAGKKETPRQKMIGMMYLVLTALLALQVSSAVLEKFAIINETLSQLVIETDKANQSQLATILKEGGKSEKPEIKAAVESAQKVRDLTTNTNKWIEELKKEMLKVSGSDKVDESLINNHGSAVATMMIDKKNKWGKEFETTLNNYVKELNSLTGENFKTLAKAPKDIPVFASDPDHVRKDFLTFTFENTPVIAALASVSQIQTEVLEYESVALRKLAEKAGAARVAFENIIPMVRPKSSIVAAGAPYEADMFISASSSALSPEMTYNGKPIPVEVDNPTGIKMGRLKFTAAGGNYDAQGLSKQTFKAEIKLNDEVYEQTIEYFVAKPVIRVTTGTAPTLYMGCGNSVNIEVPALGTNYNPTFSATGAEIQKGPKTGNVIIIPSQRKVNVSVNNSGTFIGTEQFDVKNVPRPRIIAKDNNGRDIDLKNGVKAGAIAGLRINADPDENFKAEVPQDANFRIRNMSVILARGTQRVQEMTMTSEIIDLSAWRALMRPGDRIIVEPKTVVRMTFKGNAEPVTVSGNDIITIPIQ
ncbi:MAG: gliding motility protein GldM [Cyclobacteriaceae bacterium]|nr:gliding motility protein GldM [Cyclobacteriaceae bacterium]UYN86719.1 MAG: gliding motility protein GldM [Cyclobacteriaceae bacterium]